MSKCDKLKLVSSAKMANPPREPPQVVRVKRRRDEDPLQALVFEESKRSVKRPRFVFKLQRTEENDIQDSTAVLESQQGRHRERPLFSLPRGDDRSSIGAPNGALNGAPNGNMKVDGSLGAPAPVAPLAEGPPELNPDLLDMLNDYLKTHDETKEGPAVKPPKRRQSSVSQSSDVRPTLQAPACDTSAIIEDDEDEYVYDVYYRDRAVGQLLETDNIGYIRFDSDDLDYEEDEVPPTDDEDSNDENFYRNDYPEDEDGGYDSEAVSLGLEEPSDDQDDEFDILTHRRRFSRLDFERSEGVVGMDQLEPLEADVREQRIVPNGEDPDGDVDMDASMDADDTLNTPLKRHTFFPSDKNDPIAIHRDRIFNRLQDLIDE